MRHEEGSYTHMSNLAEAEQIAHDIEEAFPGCECYTHESWYWDYAEKRGHLGNEYGVSVVTPTREVYGTESKEGAEELKRLLRYSTPMWEAGKR